MLMPVHQQALSVSRNFMDTAKKIEEFIMKAAPVEWWEYAQELKNASEELSRINDNSFISTYHSDIKEIVKRPGVSRTYMLTIGICLENLLKGLLIAENPDYVKDGRIDQSISAGHNLYDLSNKSSTFTFTDEERQLFKILSDAVPYWGKYPIPKKFEQIKSETHSTPEIRAIFLELYKKLERHIYDMTKFGWDGPNNVHLGEWFVSDLEDLPEGYEKIPFDELHRMRRKKQKSG